MRELQRAEREAREAAGLANAKRHTNEAQTLIKHTETLLKRAPNEIQVFDFNALVAATKVPPPRSPEPPAPLPNLESYLPPRLSLWLGWIPFVRERHDLQTTDAQARYELDVRSAEAENLAREKRNQEANARHVALIAEEDAKAEASRTAMESFRNACQQFSPPSLVEYFEKALAPEAKQRYVRTLRVAYTDRKLVLEVDTQTLAWIPENESFRYIKTSNEVRAKLLANSERKRLYASMIAQLTLREAFAVFSNDMFDAVDVAVISIFTNDVDRRTGQEIHPCLLSASISKTTFSNLVLDRIDPVECLKGLNARVSPSPDELQAVKPLVNFNMVDPRFIDKTNVLSELDQRPNLAELSPSEFEALMTNLFEKMGLETRLTRASRDGGVDCVAWDMRPILGGKVVVQAKRYKNVVGVAAVRDLFGALTNERASKGILVTTSHFGRGSEEFAHDKPIELINGSNLLYLLKEHAGVDAKIEFPENWIDPIPDE